MTLHRTSLSSVLKTPLTVEESHLSGRDLRSTVSVLIGSFSILKSFIKTQCNCTSCETPGYEEDRLQQKESIQLHKSMGIFS